MFRASTSLHGHPRARSASSTQVLALLLAASIVTPAAAAVHPGDRVAVLVYNHPELSEQTTVDGSGKISLPLAGGVDTTNLDPAQIAARVRYALKPYVRKAAVDVQLVTQAGSVFVAGGPGGVLAYSPGENLAGALAQLRAQAAAVNNVALEPPASSELENGRIDLQHVQIVRDGAVIGPLDATSSGLGNGGAAILRSGDTIQLQNKPIVVTVRGEVKAPGVAYLNPTDSASAALAQAGGALPSSATNGITIDRGGLTHHVALGSPEFSEPAQTGDVIFVPRAPVVGVVGMVVKPGDVTLTNDRTLLSALYAAGGVQQWADLKKVRVLHRGSPTTYDVTALIHGDVSQNPPLDDGDTVFVPEGRKIDWTPLFAGLGTALGVANRLIPLHYVP